MSNSPTRQFSKALIGKHLLGMENPSCFLHSQPWCRSHLGFAAERKKTGRIRAPDWFADWVFMKTDWGNYRQMFPKVGMQIEELKNTKGNWNSVQNQTFHRITELNSKRKPIWNFRQRRNSRKNFLWLKWKLIWQTTNISIENWDILFSLSPF